MRRHQHNSLYSINNFKKWQGEAFRIHQQRYRGRRDRIEHKRRQWLFPWDKNPHVMLVWKEQWWWGSTTENESKNLQFSCIKEDNGILWSAFNRDVHKWLFLQRGTVSNANMDSKKLSAGSWKKNILIIFFLNCRYFFLCPQLSKNTFIAVVWCLCTPILLFKITASVPYS